MNIAGLDVGKNRIGIAIADTITAFARPLSVIERRSTASDIESLVRILATNGVDRAIFGLPLNMDGSEGPMARHVRNFAARFAQRSGIAVKFQDERLSSFEAESRLVGQVRRSRKKAAVDAVAAAVILESWLEANRLKPGGAS